MTNKPFPTFRQWANWTDCNSVSDEELEHAVKGTKLYTRYEWAKAKYETGGAFKDLSLALHRLRAALFGSLKGDK